MTVHHLSFLLPSLKGGGVQRQYIHLARAFLQRGHQVDMILLDASSPAFDNLPDWNLVDLHSRRALTSLPALTRFLHTARPDFLISAQTHVNALAAFARGRIGAPPRLMVTEHNHLSAATQNAFRFGDKLRPWMVRLLYPRADWIVAVSASVADDLARASGLPREKIQVIYNAVDVDEVTRLAREPLDHPWFAPGEPPVILAVGRLTPQKAYPDLIHTFAQVRSRRAARLLILGEGEERGQLQEQIEHLGLTGDIAMPGFVTNPFAYMRRAALLALSSHWEGFVSVLPEALACGLPVVSTDHPGGGAETLAHGKYGRLVPVGDIPAFAAALESTLDSPPPRDLLLARARDFSVARMADAYLDCLTGGA
jgi:glycosyltransferase involved in cell wall biosynthesis